MRESAPSISDFLHSKNTDRDHVFVYQYNLDTESTLNKSIAIDTFSLHISIAFFDFPKTTNLNWADRGTSINFTKEYIAHVLNQRTNLQRALAKYIFPEKKKQTNKQTNKRTY